MIEYAHDINQMLLNKAYFYICGDAANMAKAVLTALHKILSEQRNISEEKAEEIIRDMRALNQYQVRQKESFFTLFIIGGELIKIIHIIYFSPCTIFLNVS